MLEKQLNFANLFLNTNISKPWKNSKNGYFNCKKYKAIPIDDLIKERNSLIASKEDPRRLDFLTNKIMEFNGGIL